MSAEQPRRAAENDDCNHPTMKTRGRGAWWCELCARHICPEDRQRILKQRESEEGSSQ